MSRLRMPRVTGSHVTYAPAVLWNKASTEKTKPKSSAERLGLLCHRQCDNTKLKRSIADGGLCVQSSVAGA